MNGMNITSKDLIEIIKACKGSRVKNMKFGDVELTFDTENHLSKTKKSTTHMEVDSAGVEGQPPVPDSPTEYVHDEGMTVFELADQLAIEDPATYEEMQIRAFSAKGED